MEQTNKEESNAEATRRISQELRDESKMNEKRDSIMSYYFEITGRAMTEQEFKEYIELYNKAEQSYNIKTYVRDKQRIKEDNATIKQKQEESNTDVE